MLLPLLRRQHVSNPVKTLPSFSNPQLGLLLFFTAFYKDSFLSLERKLRNKVRVKYSRGTSGSVHSMCTLRKKPLALPTEFSVALKI